MPGTEAVRYQTWRCDQCGWGCAVGPRHPRGALGWAAVRHYVAVHGTWTGGQRQTWVVWRGVA
jgi:hypothetical protein